MKFSPSESESGPLVREKFSDEDFHVQTSLVTLYSAFQVSLSDILAVLRVITFVYHYYDILSPQRGTQSPM